MCYESCPFKQVYSLPLNVRQELGAGLITCFSYGYWFGALCKQSFSKRLTLTFAPQIRCRYHASFTSTNHGRYYPSILSYDYSRLHVPCVSQLPLIWLLGLRAQHQHGNRLQVNIGFLSGVLLIFIVLLGICILWKWAELATFQRYKLLPASG
jgi:hypothetical protein